MPAFIITDERGRETLIIKKTERAARMAWRRLQQENQREWQWKPLEIISVRQVGW